MVDLSNENVIYYKKGDMEYLQFRRLLEYSDVINHVYGMGIKTNFRTSKAVTKEPLSENEYKKAINDYSEICSLNNMDYINIVKANQEHTKNVEIITEKVNKDLPDFKEHLHTDGLITNKKNLILTTTNADCILFLMFDPVEKVIASVHSGWKGTLQKISVETIKKMKNNFGCDPKNIICCICPSIRKCHFEVSQDVKEMFQSEFENLGNCENFIEQKSIDKWNIDTVEINKIILRNEGLINENIIDSKICSVCNSEHIHSYRVEKEGYGLNTAMIEIVK